MNTLSIESNLSTSSNVGGTNIAQIAVQLIVSLDQAVDRCYDTIMSFFSYPEAFKSLSGTGGSPTVHDSKKPLESGNLLRPMKRKELEENTGAGLGYSDIHSVWVANFMF